MKTALSFIITAILLGFASVASGRPFDAADFLAIAFSTGLVAWTVSQYSRELKPLSVTRPVRLPVTLRRSATFTTVTPPSRVAA